MLLPGSRRSPVSAFPMFLRICLGVIPFASLQAVADPIVEYMSREQLEKSIERTRKLMKEAADKMEYIEAAQYRDEMMKLQELLKKKE